MNGAWIRLALADAQILSLTQVGDLWQASLLVIRCRSWQRKRWQ